jgi:5'-nucleotidase
MRIKNDNNLADKVPELDLILGGHDHVDEEWNINDVFLLKSGTDFRQFSIIKIRMN